MSARPRKVSDEEVFGAVLRVMNRLAPAQVTLSEIAREAGVTPSALVQRYGSKRELLLDVIGRAAEGTGEFFAQLRDSQDSPLSVLYAYGECFATMADSPETLAHHLGYLQLDLTDSDFRSHARSQARAADREIRRQLEDAASRGELNRGTDLDMLTRAVVAVLGGTLIAWAIRQEGTAVTWMRKDLGAVLAPHLSARGRASTRSAARRSSVRRA